MFLVPLVRKKKRKKKLTMINFSNLIQIMPTENGTSIDKVNHRHNQLKRNLLTYTREQLI